MAIFDFSEYQGTIDFGKVKGNADLVILRVQAGSTHADADYTKYVAESKANGIPFGTYAYGRFTSISDAQVEATNCYNRMDKATEFVVVDVESVSTTVASQLVPATQAYVDKLHSLGVKKVGLYSGENFYKTNGLSGVKADFLWIANYGANDGKQHTKPSIACDLWQFSSSATESGVIGHVDIDALNGSKPLSYFTGGPIIPTSDGSGVLTVSTQGAKLYSSDDMNSAVIRTLNKGETYKYYSIVRGWYAVGNSWVRNVDIEVNSWIPAQPKPTPTPAPQPAPQPAPKPVVNPQPVAQPMPSGNVNPPEKSVLVPPIVQPSANTVQPSANTVVAPSIDKTVELSASAPQVIVEQPKVVIATPIVVPPVQAQPVEPVPVEAPPVVPPVEASPIIQDLAQQIENAVLKDPQLQKSIVQKLFSFVVSIFK